MTDFGGKLREAREARGVSLRQIAANTKISVGALEALERDEISKLPGGIFSRSFVRSYAAEVGLDPEQTVAEFLQRFHSETLPDPAVNLISDEETAQATERRAAGIAFSAILAVIVFGGIVTYFALRGNETGATPASAAPPPRAEVATTPPPATGPTGGVPAVDDVLRATGPMRLDIHPIGPCWVKLTADGQDVFARLMQAGQRESLTVRNLAVISIGDAAVFSFSVDGRPGRILGSAGEVKTARISRDTLAEYLR